MSAENILISFWHRLNATRVITSTVGVFCGIDGLVHGVFETLQGNTVPPALLSSAIGPANRFWPGGNLHALTIIPNFFITGILAILASLMVIIWSTAFIHRKHGATIFLLLSLLQFLVGGGFGQIFLVLLAAAAASQINAPLHWWRAHLSAQMQHFLAKLWLWLLIGFVLTYSSAMFAGIFGYLPVLGDASNLGAENITNFLYMLGYTALGLLLLTFVAGFAQDIQSQSWSKS